jgi:hypothetical protein
MQSGTSSDIPRYFSDTLRAVGLFLEQLDARGIEINDEGDQWSVAWQEAPSTSLAPLDLDALRRVARLHRGLHSRDSIRFTRAHNCVPSATCSTGCTPPASRSLRLLMVSTSQLGL